MCPLTLIQPSLGELVHPLLSPDCADIIASSVAKIFGRRIGVSGSVAMFSRYLKLFTDRTLVLKQDWQSPVPGSHRNCTFA